MGRGVQRGHLQRNDGIAAALDGMPDDPVHVPVMDQRARVAVVGAQDEVPGIKALLRYGGDLAFDVMPCRTEAEHRLHPLPDAADCVHLARALMVVRGSAGGVGMESGSEIGRRIMPAHGPARIHGGGDLRQHVRIPGNDAGKVHHFAQPGNSGPAHGLNDVLRHDFGPGRLQSRRRGCA